MSAHNPESPEEANAPKFLTDDGYKFLLAPDGRVTDSLDPEKEDMSWPCLADFFSAMKSQKMGFSTTFPE